MPKELRFKRHDQHKHKHKHKSRHSREHASHTKREKKTPYDPPKVYENEEGWAPSAGTYKDDDDDWRERLFSAMTEDEGCDPFYSNYDENYGGGGVNAMSDEEYRRYMVDGMYRKQHAEEIAQEEARRAAKEERRRRRREEREKLEREEEVRRAMEAQIRQESDQKRILERRDRHERQWETIEQASTVSKKNIPWPVYGSFSLQGVRAFLVDTQQNTNELKRTIRKEQLRYHPDKFVRRVLAKLHPSDKKDYDRLETKMNDVSGWLNELWKDLCT